MSAVAEMVRPSSLDAEWKRIEVLAQCLLASRAEREPGQSLIEQLHSLQLAVEQGRANDGCWPGPAGDDLPPLALDLLACTYAPAVSPAVALLYQDLQQRGSEHPSLAFIHRLLALDETEYCEAERLSSLQGELSRRGLLTVDGTGPMRLLRPHQRMLSLLTGDPADELKIPGAIPIRLRANWDDLILPKAQRRMLHEYLLWIRHGERVMSEWGGREIYGPVALFSGPSGTGKTFAASVIAQDLGWPLYRVDLGALVSKYIGETEKNLNSLFDAVHGQQVLLQFDEVDALMGKRGEVKDARDRYANMEVSHLLSRIEQHQGPCILTTNLRKQIDQAFLRRFQFVVGFPRPEGREREALWQRLLPPQAPFDADLDISLVADAVALTGGEIRNAATHAAVLAASQDAPIGLAHVALGVWRVLQKSDGQVRSNQMRQLAKHLPAEILNGEGQ